MDYCARRVDYPPQKSGKPKRSVEDSGLVPPLWSDLRRGVLRARRLARRFHVQLLFGEQKGIIVIKRLIGSGVVAAALTVGMVAQTAAPASAAGVAGAVITGTVNTAITPVQFQNVALAGAFVAAPTAGACATTVAVNNLTINYSLESPAEGPLPAGILFNVGSFAAGGTFGGGNAVCTVNGAIGNGALFGATGDSFVSVGAVALAELQVNYTATTLTLSANSGPSETLAVVTAAPGACTSAPLNLNCATVAGVAVVA